MFNFFNKDTGVDYFINLAGKMENNSVEYDEIKSEILDAWEAAHDKIEKAKNERNTDMALEGLKEMLSLCPIIMGMIVEGYHNFKNIQYIRTMHDQNERSLIEIIKSLDKTGEKYEVLKKFRKDIGYDDL